MFGLKMLVKQAFKIICRLPINNIVQSVCGHRIVILKKRLLALHSSVLLFRIFLALHFYFHWSSLFVKSDISLLLKKSWLAYTTKI